MFWTAWALAADRSDKSDSSARIARCNSSTWAYEKRRRESQVQECKHTEGVAACYLKLCTCVGDGMLEVVTISTSPQLLRFVSFHIRLVSG